MAGFRELVIGMILVGLFFIATVNFGINLAADNGKNSTLLNDSTLNQTYVDTQSNLYSAYDSSNASRTSFETEDVKATSDNLVLSTIKGVGTAFGSTSVGLYNVLFGFAGDVLGIPSIILSTFATILTMVIVFYAWRLYRAGE